MLPVLLNSSDHKYNKISSVRKPRGLLSGLEGDQKFGRVTTLKNKLEEFYRNLQAGHMTLQHGEPREFNRKLHVDDDDTKAGDKRYELAIHINYLINNVGDTECLKVSD